MAKIIKRKARKDYPANGIVKGDDYFFCQIKTGPRSNRILRSKEPFKPSQLTTSPYKSSFYSAQEAWGASDKDEGAMREAAEAIREIGQECQSSFDNMPEGLQQGETGQLLENRANECERIVYELDQFADEYESLEEPVEPEDEMAEEMDGRDRVDLEEQHDEYQTALAEYGEAQDALKAEADGCIGDMPE